MCPIVNVGLVTGTVTPSARQAPRTNVVLPEPSSPLTSTTSPGASASASRAPAASVSGGELVEKPQLLALLTDRRFGFRLGLRLGVLGVLGVLGEQLRQLLEVLVEKLLDRRAAQAGSRVADREQDDGSPAEHALLRPSMAAHDPGRAAGEELGGEVAERADDLRLDQLDLAEQVR